MSKTNKRTDWAEDDDDDLDTSVLPAPEVTKNDDGTETHVSYRWREDGKKVKTTRIIKRSVVRTRVNPRVAERRAWPKFGDAASDGPGPQSSTTSIGENIDVTPRQGFSTREPEQQASTSELEKKKADLVKATVKCRRCKGDHFTSRCPYQGTMGLDEPGVGPPVADPMAEEMGSGGGGGKSSYVPPHLRGAGGERTGEKMGGKYERDDLATLRVTNVSEYAEESELRERFEKCGRVTRVFLAKDRDTQRAKGFAFISFADRSDAARACEAMDGHGYNNLILRVEFAKKTT